LTSLVNEGLGGTEISRTLYTYDKVGNITTVSVGPQGGEGTTFYTYDSLNRLIGVEAPNTANDHAYTYDKVGNRLTHTKDGVVHVYVYNVNNQLMEVRQGSVMGPLVAKYEYDSNGNRLTKRNVDDTTLQSFVYDQKNRVTGMSTPGKSFYFKYDPSDYRIKNNDGGFNTRNYYLEGEHLEAIYDETFQLQDQYFRGVVVDEVVHGLHYDSSGNESGTTYHHDHLRSVTSLVETLGSAQATMQYGPFGELITETGSDNGNRLHYTGRELDDSGLYYYRARYYDPEVGRFLTEDSMGFRAGINFYAYVENNPINASDPSGLLSLIHHFGITYSAARPSRASGGQFFKLWT